MSSWAELSDIEEKIDIQKLWQGLPDSNQVHIKDLDDTSANLILKTKNQLPNLAPSMPHSSDKSLVGRVEPISVDNLEAQNSRLEGLISELDTVQTTVQAASENATPFSFPHLAWEAVKAGLAKEELTNRQLNTHIKEAEKHQKDIDLLLDFSAELTAHKEDTEMSEKMKNLLSELKERGIDLWKSEEKTLSKDKISELKSLSGAQVDKLRSNLQIIFTTKIQSLIQSIGAIMETLKDIIRNNTKLINAANRLPGH